MIASNLSERIFMLEKWRLQLRYVQNDILITCDRIKEGLFLRLNKSLFYILAYCSCIETELYLTKDILVIIIIFCICLSYFFHICLLLTWGSSGPHIVLFMRVLWLPHCSFFFSQNTELVVWLSCGPSDPILYFFIFQKTS